MTTFYLQRKKIILTVKAPIQPMKTFYLQRRKKIYLLVKKTNFHFIGKIIFFYFFEDKKLSLVESVL